MFGSNNGAIKNRSDNMIFGRYSIKLRTCCKIISCYILKKETHGEVEHTRKRLFFIENIYQECVARGVGCNICVATHVLHCQLNTLISVCYLLLSLVFREIVWGMEYGGLT